MFLKNDQHTGYFFFLVLCLPCCSFRCDISESIKHPVLISSSPPWEEEWRESERCRGRAGVHQPALNWATVPCHLFYTPSPALPFWMLTTRLSLKRTTAMQRADLQPSRADQSQKLRWTVKASGSLALDHSLPSSSELDLLFQFPPSPLLPSSLPFFFIF